MHIFVGSTNPVKINAVVTAASETWPEVQVEGFAVASGIPAQPISNEQTKLGAENRATAALAAGSKLLSSHTPTVDSGSMLGVGLEGGVFQQGDQLWSTVWAVVADQHGQLFHSNGARFQVPAVVARQIMSGGEMGPIVAQLTGVDDVRQKQGMIGVITKGFIDRTEEYTGIIKMALGLWYGQGWDAAYKA